MAKQSTAAAARSSSRRNKPASGRRRPPAKKASDVHPVEWSIPFTLTNLIILGVGIGVIVIGYLLMATGISDNPANNAGIWNNANAVTVAPILLAIGYCVIIPIGIFYRSKGSGGDAPGADQQAPAEA